MKSADLWMGGGGETKNFDLVEMIRLVYCALAMIFILVCTSFFHVNMSSVSTSFLFVFTVYWPPALLVRYLFRTCFCTLLFACDLCTECVKVLIVSNRYISLI